MKPSISRPRYPRIASASSGSTTSSHLTGIIYTARDMAHLKLRELQESGKPLPEALEGAVIFHAGPVVKKSVFRL